MSHTDFPIPEIPGKVAGLLERIIALYVQLNTRKPTPLGPAPGLKGRMRNQRNPETGRKYKHEVSR
jgi:hypothetical protein